METHIDSNLTGPKVPPPPALEINIRTMENDLRALSESGGELKNAGAQMKIESSPEMASRDKISIPGYAGPEKPIFETTAPIVPASAGQVKTNSSGVNFKKVIISLIVLIWLAGLALLGYFVIWPMITK